MGYALRSDGTFVTWGLDAGGQASFPYGQTDVKQVEGAYMDTGSYWGMALKKDGTLQGWGVGLSGPLVVPTGLTNVTSFSAGYRHCAAIKSNGTVVCWGDNSKGQLNVPSSLSSVVQVSAGEYGTLALKSDGTVVGWGYNDGTISIPSGLTGVTQVSAGSGHSAALKNDGTVVCWGSNIDGAATPPAGLNGVIQVESSSRFTLALKSDGTVVVWGRNTPNVSDLANVTQISRDYTNVLALLSDGSIACRGDNSWGQCTPPVGLTNIVQASPGFHYDAFLESDGTVHCYGFDDYGQTDVPSDLVGVTQVAAGQYHVAALKSDGTVVCWGKNDLGQCNVPAGLTGVVQVAAGRDFTVALKSDGTVKAWGTNAANQVSGASGKTGITQICSGSFSGFVLALKSDGTVVAWGDNTLGPCNVPSGLSSVVQVSAGQFVSLALKSNGTVVGWGSNVSGQTSTPATTFTSIAAGSTNAGGIRASHSKLVTWGDENASEHFLLNTEGIVSVSAGYASMLALPAVVVSVAPYKATVGSNVTGTVFLTKPAPAGGANVTIVTDNVNVAAPGTVTVPAGQRSATFTINVGASAGTGVWKISATYNFYTSISTLTTVPSPLSSLDVPHSFYGDQQVTGSILLTSPAPSGYTVHLASDNSSVTVPSDVVFTTGATSATFTLTSADVTANANATITATDGTGGNANVSVTVAPNGLLSMDLNPIEVIGGSTNVVTGIVTLGGPVAADTTVNLSVTVGGSYAWVPATATVHAGSATGTFTVTHQNVTAKTFVTIAASRFGTTFIQKLTLNPNKLNSVTLSPGTAIGGSTKVVTGTVNLRAAVTTDTVVSLTSSDPAHASFPSTVTVLAGNRSASFPIVHTEVNGPSPITITGNWQADHPTATLTITPNPVTSMTLNRTSVVGSSSTTVRLIVKLSATVYEDTVVSLASSNPSAASLPATVTIPAGLRAVTVVVTHHPVGSTRTVTLSATHSGTTNTTTLTVTP